MKPLSVLKYYAGNKRRFIPVFTSLLLSVMLIYMMHVVIGAPMKTTYRELVEPYDYFSSFAAKTQPIDSDFVNRLSAIQEVDHVYPCMFFYTNIDNIIGGTVGTQVIALNGQDKDVATSTLGLTLAEGYLPKTGSNEIALHRSVARNKGLFVGSSIGSNMQVGEVLEGEFVVSGILEGESILSISSLEYELARRNIGYEYSLGVLAVPNSGKLLEMNVALDSFVSDGTVKRTHNTVTGQYDQNTASITLLMTAISIMTIAIVSICMGFLSYIYFLQRRGEFGLLSAIGYTQQQVINRAFAEITIVNLFGLSVGIGLSMMIALTIDALLFSPRGLSISIVDWDVLLKCCCVPLFTMLFSVIPVWRMLKNIDAVGILEGQVQL